VATRGGRDGLESSCMKASSMRSERGSALGERIARSAAESEAMSPGRRLMLLPGEGVKKFQFSSMLVSWEGGLVSLEGCRGKRTSPSLSYETVGPAGPRGPRLEIRGDMDGDGRGGCPGEGESGDCAELREDRRGGGGRELGQKTVVPIGSFSLLERLDVMLGR
jgi:hypothetical protein